MEEKMYCTLDTETVGGATAPKGFYHIGGIIHDRNGSVYGCFNFIIAEWIDEILTDDYAKSNVDKYFEMIFDGTATIIPTEDTAIDIVENLLEYYNVNTMCAYNSGFDYTKTKCKKLLAGREFIDLWLMAMQTVAQKKSFAKWCAENGKISAKGICKTNAETVYAFLIDNPQYKEEHTALEDSKIEFDIFNACIKTHKKFTKNCHFNDYKGRFELFPRP